MFILIPIAFISGLLTVFSPCVLPILPIILASGIGGSKMRMSGTITGLVLSFTIASLLLATIVKVFGIPSDIIRNIAVLLLIIFGIPLVFPEFGQKVQVILERYWHFQPLHAKSQDFMGGLVTGISLGIVWTPCVGPILGAVATFAALNSLSLTTLIITFSYALGVGIPLYYISKGGNSILGSLGVIKTNNQNLRQTFGAIILLTALLIYSGTDKAIQAWTLRHLPSSWTQITTTFETRFDVHTMLDSLRRTK